MKTWNDQTQKRIGWCPFYFSDETSCKYGQLISIDDLRILVSAKHVFEQLGFGFEKVMLLQFKQIEANGYGRLQKTLASPPNVTSQVVFFQRPAHASIMPYSLTTILHQIRLQFSHQTDLKYINIGYRIYMDYGIEILPTNLCRDVWDGAGTTKTLPGSNKIMGMHKCSWEGLKHISII